MPGLTTNQHPLNLIIAGKIHLNLLLPAGAYAGSKALPKTEENLPPMEVRVVIHAMISHFHMYFPD